MPTISMTVNNKTVTGEVEARTLLVQFIREHLGLDLKAQKVTLTEDGEGTLLSYEVEAKVGGKLAQLGGRIIDPAAKKLANEFFGSFTEILGGVEAPAPVPAAEAAAEKRVLGLSPLVWAAGAVIILALGLFFYFD